MSGVELGTSQRPKNLADRAFAGLPIPGVKKAVAELTTPKSAEDTLNDILSGKLTVTGEGKSGRKLDTASGFYVYNLSLSDSTQIDVIFYSVINTKVLVRIGNTSIEMQTGNDNLLLKQISKVYPLPVYTQDGIGGVRLLASN